MESYLIRRNAFRFLLSLSLILSTGCAGLQTVTSEMECALKGETYAGYKTGATVTDVTYYESSTEIRTAPPEYAHYCRPPKTQSERVEVNKLKFQATAVMAAILGVSLWWVDKRRDDFFGRN